MNPEKYDTGAALAVVISVWWNNSNGKFPSEIKEIIIPSLLSFVVLVCAEGARWCGCVYLGVQTCSHAATCANEDRDCRPHQCLSSTAPHLCRLASGLSLNLKLVGKMPNELQVSTFLCPLQDRILEVLCHSDFFFGS